MYLFKNLIGVLDGWIFLWIESIKYSNRINRYDLINWEYLKVIEFKRCYLNING